MEEAQSRGCTTASAAAAAAAAALTLSLPVQGQGRAGGVVGSAVVGSGVVGSGVVGAADSEKVVGGGGAGVGGREDCWSEAATFTLIQAWGAHYVELNRGNLKQKHWKEVADAVNVREEGKAAKTDVQCKNRLDTLKKKYKLEKIKLAEAAGNAANGSGNGHGSANPSTVPGSSSGSSKWPFFRKLDELIGTSRKHKKQQQVPAGGGEKGVRCAGGSPPTHQQKQEQPQQQQQQLQQRGQRRGKEEETRMAGLLLPAAPAQHNGPAGSGSTKSKESPDMTDSCPHALGEEGAGGAAGAGARGNKNKKSKVDGNNGGGAAAGPGPGLGPGPSDRATEAKSFKKRKLQDGPYKDLARAIIKFGEVYERIESAKQRQLTELEKQRMEFTKDLELQRMQLFIQAQVELAKLKHAKHGGAGNENFL